MFLPAAPPVMTPVLNGHLHSEPIAFAMLPRYPRTLVHPQRSRDHSVLARAHLNPDTALGPLQVLVLYHPQHHPLYELAPDVADTDVDGRSQNVPELQGRCFSNINVDFPYQNVPKVARNQ